MPTAAHVKEERLNAADEKRLADVEKCLYGNGRPGLLREHASLVGYLRGATAVGGLLSLVMIALLTWVLNSISTIENEISQHANPISASAKER